MQTDPSIPRRRTVRLPAFDYSTPGAYFITICAKDKKLLFGRMDGIDVRLTPLGRIVDQCWMDIPTHFPEVDLREHIVMPDHLHGIIVLRRVQNGEDDAKISMPGTACRAPTDRKSFA